LLSISNIDVLAKKVGFCKRKSKLSSLLFMKMLIFDHLLCDQPSLQQHGFSLYNESGKRLSKQGIDKRFNKSSVALIQSVFESYVASQLKTDQLPSSLRDRYTSIRIMDSTEFKLPASASESFPGFSGDGTKACAQIQFEFDILSGKINHLSIESALVADSTYASNRIHTLKENELVLRDLGYYTLRSYKEIESCNAYYISRLKSQLNIYERRGISLKRVTHRSLIKRLRQSGKSYLDMPVCIGGEGNHSVRLIANLVDERSIAHRLQNKKRRKSTLNQSDKLSSQLNLFVTNIPPCHCTADDLYQLYKVRWQIELMFKTWKSVLKIDQIRKMKTDRLKCYLYSKLLWIVLSWDICRLHRLRIWKSTHSFISLYKCFSLLKIQANKIKDILFSSISKIHHWIENLYDVFIDYGLTENRINRLRLSQLLRMDTPVYCPKEYLCIITNEAIGINDGLKKQQDEEEKNVAVQLCTAMCKSNR
jgi:Transposase DDE domain